MPRKSPVTLLKCYTAYVEILKDQCFLVCFLHRDVQQNPAFFSLLLSPSATNEQHWASWWAPHIISSFQTQAVQAHIWPFRFLPSKFTLFFNSPITLPCLLRDVLQHFWVQAEILLFSLVTWPRMGIRDIGHVSLRAPICLTLSRSTPPSAWTPPASAAAALCCVTHSCFSLMIPCSSLPNH